jgi:hypothetical protein
VQRLLGSDGSGIDAMGLLHRAGCMYVWRKRGCAQVQVVSAVRAFVSSIALADGFVPVTS